MKYRTLSSLLALSLLIGCSSSDKVVVPDIPAAELYANAEKALREGSWTKALEQLEALDSRYPFGAYSQQVQLDIIYAYYKSDQLPLALASIERFIRLNPTHSKLDWVIYMRGLTHMAQDGNFLHDLLKTDRYDRDPEPVKNAFNDFKSLLQKYPDSIYAADAERRLFFLKNRLARHDLAAADFYLRREAWIAAINRCQELQKTFPDTEAARKSLEIQLEAYSQLGLYDAVERTQQLMMLNPI